MKNTNAPEAVSWDQKTLLRLFGFFTELNNSIECRLECWIIIFYVCQILARSVNNQMKFDSKDRYDRFTLCEQE